MKHPANYVALIQMLKHTGLKEKQEDEKPKEFELEEKDLIKQSNN